MTAGGARGRRWLLLLLGLTLVRGMIYAAVVPPWQAPDETGHFEYAWLVAQEGQLPDQEDVSPAFERELLGSLYEWRYGEYTQRQMPAQMPAHMNGLPESIFARRSRTVVGERFSLAYVWQALFLLPARHQGLVLQLYAARLSSVLLNVLIVLLAYRTFETLKPARPGLTALMAGLIVFLPQHTFINSTVGDGPMAELAACVVLYSWVTLFQKGIVGWRTTGIVIGTLAGIWSKTTAVFLMPLNALLVLWWFLRRQSEGRDRQRWGVLLVSGVILGLGIWLWSGTALGAKTLLGMDGFLSSPEWAWVDSRGLTLWEGLLSSYDSFWANFGWMTLPLSERWYGAVFAFSVLAVLGWVAGEQTESRPWGGLMMSAALCMALGPFVWAALLTREAGYYQSQGRYLFPIIVPCAYLLVEGWDRLFSIRLRRPMAAIFLLFLVCFDSWSMAGYVWPYFYS
jgi:hypothetical protein